MVTTRRADRRRPRARTAATFGAVVLALLPVVVATARAVGGGWRPLSDDGLVAVRARDALSRRPPLIGSFSSASNEIGVFHNHPGPLLFDLLAVPARLHDAAGTALGAGLLNGLAIVAVAVLAHRRGGPLLAVLSMVVTTALTWTMGSSVLYDPWQPHVLILPFLCFLFVVWSLRCGDAAVLPLGALVGSLLLQSHLSYALLVPALALWGVAGLVLATRRLRRDTTVPSPPTRNLGRPFGLAGVVLAVCWAKPLIEQFNPRGGGNMALLVETATTTEVPTLGLDFGARIVATVVALPPWWVRPSFGDDFQTLSWSPPSTGAAVVSLLVVAVVLGACLLVARRHGDGVAGPLTGTVVVGLLVALGTAARAPESGFGIAPHQFRWLWPLAALAVLAVGVTAVRRLRPDGGAARVTLGAGLVGVAVLALLGLPAANMEVGPNTVEKAMPVLRDIGDQLGPLREEGRLLLDVSALDFIADPYAGAVMAELRRQGIPFVVDDRALVRHFFPHRRFNGRNARSVLHVRTADGVRTPPPGSRRVAAHEGNRAAERGELARLRRRIQSYVDDGRLRFRPGVEEKLSSLAEAVDPDGALRLEPSVVLRLYREGNLVLDDGWEQRFARYSELQRRNDDETVALFLAPLDAR